MEPSKEILELLEKRRKAGEDANAYESLVERIMKNMVVILLYTTAMFLWTLIPPIVFIGSKYSKTGEEIKSYVQSLDYWMDFYLTKMIIMFCLIVILYETIIIVKEFFRQI